MKRSNRLIGILAVATSTAVVLLQTSRIDAFATATLPSTTSYRIPASLKTTQTSSRAFLTSKKKLHSLRSSDRIATSFLSAVVVDTLYSTTTDTGGKLQSKKGSSKTSSSQPKKEGHSLMDFLGPVLSAALLVTGNTFGAGCLVLPELAKGPGMAAFSSLFLGAWTINLVSGLILAEVAIRQKEAAVQQGDDNVVPSSFKEFAQVNLNSSTAANGVSAISVFVNSCVMSFDLSRVGQVGANLSGQAVPNELISAGWGLLLVTILSTQSSKNLSRAASMCATVLFLSFGSLLLPGLAHVTDPWQVWTAPAAIDFTGSLAAAAPVVLMSMIYQNVVPSVTKILNYDRVQTVSALTLGSLLPLVMYVAWCFAWVGGGIDTTIGTTAGIGGLLMTVFSLATLAGSSIGSGMSLSEEIDTFVQPNAAPRTKSGDTENEQAVRGEYQIPSVLLAVTAPLLAANVMTATGHDTTEALRLAGSFGSPLLYGAIPALMAWQQRAQQSPKSPHMIPTAGLGALGLLSTGFVGNELVDVVERFLAVPV